MPSGNRIRIEQKARTETTIRASQQKILEAEILKLSDDELLKKIDNELTENGAIEKGLDNDGQDAGDEGYDHPQDEDEYLNPSNSEPFTDYDSEELPVYARGHADNDKTEITIGDTISFVDVLKAQIADSDIKDEKQKELIEYLIGSLNDNGFIDPPLEKIKDDLNLYHNIDASEEELEEALKILQSFDPPGIGARNLQECLLIQIRRREEEVERNVKEKSILNIAEQVVENHFELFKRRDLQKIMDRMKISVEDMKDAMTAISRLNPRPGLSLSEGATDGNQAIQPDFIVETTMDGDVAFSLRNDEIPPLRVSNEYKKMLADSKEKATTERQKEELKYISEKVNRAQGFIDAVKKRHDTLRKIMKAIIKSQKQFFITLDESDLKPLTGEEIAKMANVDGSTVSRVVADRYAMVDGRMFPLKSFFMRTKRNSRGEEVVRTEVVAAIRDILESEDIQAPLSDEKISSELRQRGINISRRTVTKYREQMGIPTAAGRKQSIV